MGEIYTKEMQEYVRKEVMNQAKQNIGLSEATGWRIIDALYTIIEILGENAIDKASRSAAIMDKQTQ